MFLFNNLADISAIYKARSNGFKYWNCCDYSKKLLRKNWRRGIENDFNFYARNFFYF